MHTVQFYQILLIPFIVPNRTITRSFLHKLSIKQSITFLESAIHNKKFDILKFLLQHSNINVQLNSDNISDLLFYAIEENCVKAVELLLKHSKTDPNLLNDISETPLHYAIEHNYISIVKLLLHHPKIDLNLLNINNETELMWAAQNGHIDYVQLLKTAGAKKSRFVTTLLY